MRRVFLVGLLLFVLFTACKRTEERQPEATYRVVGDTVYVSNKNLLEEKIKFAVAKTEMITREVITAGTIQAIPTQYAYIAPPFAGRVVKSFMKLGQQVSKNTPLFQIISTDFTSAQKEYFQAESDLTLAKTNLARQEDLKNNGVSSQRELEEATNALYLSEKEFENATEALKVFQTDLEHMKLGEPLVIRAPIAGDVIENNLVTGQYLSSEAEHVAIIADLSKVWVVAQVKERDIRFIHKGDKMDIYIASRPNEPITGEVYYIDDAIDVETRSIRVLSICDNENRELKLGMYATVHFFDQPNPYVVVPEKAILQGEDSSYLFAKIGEGKLVRKSVTVISTQNGKAVVSGDIKDGETIVGEGGYYFK